MSSHITQVRMLTVFKRYPRWLGLLTILPLLTLPFLPALTRVVARAERAAGSNRSSTTIQNPARLSESVSVRAAGRGNPKINLSDGHAVLTSFAGPEELQQAMTQHEAQPLSMASADFDEDGVPDLVSGYVYQGRGVVSLWHGNVDAIYPNAPAAQQRRATATFTDAPFLSPASLFSVPSAAEFIGAGDFDGDSHWDIVTGSRAGNALHLLAGDGHGGFSAPRTIYLPGVLTAFVTGEINRADGLTDVVVGVTTPEGARVLVFEGPNGALKAQPEELPMPDGVTALALGQLDNGYEMDLAVGAGEHLLIVHGRDRKLSLDPEQQNRVPRARIERRGIGSQINALTVGEFRAAQGPALALVTEDGTVMVLDPVSEAGQNRVLSHRRTTFSLRTLSTKLSSQETQLIRAKVSSLPGDDLVALGGSTNDLRLLTNVQANRFSETVSLDTASPPVAVLPMQLNSDALTDLVVLQAGQSAPNLVPTAPLQTFIVNSTADTDDGVCDGASCTLREAINAANQSAGAADIRFNIAGAGVHTISPTSPLPTITDPADIETACSSGCNTGPDINPSPLVEINGAGAGAGTHGLVITGGSSRVSGLIINRFSGVAIFIFTNGGNIIDSNYLGTDPSGATALGNATGVDAGSNGNVIRGNVVSGNGSGVRLVNGGSGNQVRGNLIGTNAAGTIALPNTAIGVAVVNSPNNTVGGAAAGSGNLISGNNNSGVEFSGSSAAGNSVLGNSIGTNLAGTAAVPNKGPGVSFLSNANNNMVGGTSTAARNLLSGNQAGVSFIGAGSGTIIQGNYIGTNAAGNAALPNTIDGIAVSNSANNQIGGTASGAGNLISGNNNIGVEFNGANASGNTVAGNFIGTNAAGTAAIPNKASGVAILTDAKNNTVGGTSASARNIISCNFSEGVGLIEAGSGNIVQGNYLGTDVTGTNKLGNGLSGIYLRNSSLSLLGGDTPGAGNVISGNSGPGIIVYTGDGPSGPRPATDNRIEGNYIGTDVSGTANLGNTLDGIQITISIAPATNTIGGATPAKRNLISGNGRNGVAIGIRIRDPITGDLLPGTGGTGITVQNNYIGTDVNGNNCIGNTLDGLFVDADSFQNTFRDNLITCNGRNGVFIPQNNNPGVRIFIDSNNIYNNAALGIDLGAAGITTNDPLDIDGGANLQQNFPELTAFGPVATGDGSHPLKPDSPKVSLTVNATLNSAPNTVFTVHWYFSSDSQCISNQAASRPLLAGKVPGVTTDSNGNASFSFPFEFPNGFSSGIINSTATDAQGNTSEFSSCLTVSANPPPTVNWSATIYTAGENVGSVQLAVARTGSTAGAASVNYATSDNAGASGCSVLNSGVASSRCDYETTVGTLRFAAGETSKTIMIPVVDDVYAEGGESFTVTLSSPTGALLGSPSVATVTINDNDGTTGTNPFTQAGYFVRMQYLDFFSREPDTSGLNFWTNEITSCGSNTQCTEIKRINVSAAFYLSIEFRDTGYLVERIYRSAYGNGTGTSTLGGTHQFSVPVIRFEEFLPDTQEIGRGVVVGQTGWEQVLENNKQAFLNAFVQRSRFNTAFPGSLTPAQYVDALNVNAGGALSPAERNQLVTDLTTGAKTRAQVLRAVAEDPDLNTAENNRAFVLMQFYGYLRRNPNDAPDADYTGYDFWLSKLNQFNGNFVNAEMVKAFIQSDEYRHRFGP